jgi:hypothetical protein
MHLRSKEMRQEKKTQSFRSLDSADFDPERNLGELERKIQILRDLVRTAAERPDFFWKRQHNIIMASMKKPVRAAKHRPALLWAPIALTLIMCLFFFVENSRAPTPDFAAGADQELLVGIERALSRDYPEALAPAAVIDGVIERTSNTAIDENQSRSK